MAYICLYTYQDDSYQKVIRSWVGEDMGQMELMCSIDVNVKGPATVENIVKVKKEFQKYDNYFWQFIQNN